MKTDLVNVYYFNTIIGKNDNCFNNLNVFSIDFPCLYFKPNNNN